MLGGHREPRSGQVQLVISHGLARQNQGNLCLVDLFSFRPAIREHLIEGHLKSGATIHSVFSQDVRQVIGIDTGSCLKGVQLALAFRHKLAE